MSRKKVEVSNYSFGKRLKYLRLNANLTLEQLAKVADIPKSTLSELENDKYNPSASTLVRLSEHFGISSNYLLTGEGEMHGNEKNGDFPSHPDVRKAIPIPIVGTVPAGFPETAPEEDHILDYLYLPDVPKNAFAMEVRGESMAPTVRSGDYAVFVRAGKSEIKSGDLIIVCNEWGELILKRFRKKGDEIFLTSDNPEYPTVKPNEHYRSVGKVIKVIREVKF